MCVPAQSPLPTDMAELIKRLNPVISHYRDRRFDGNQEQFEERLRTSTTVYVGNLSFYTTEDQIYEASGWQAGRCMYGDGALQAAQASLRLPCRSSPSVATSSAS